MPCSVAPRGFALLFLAVALGGPAATARAEDKPSVQALLDESNRQYAAKDFAGAARTLERLYAMHPAPRVLFNLARAYERAGDAARAEQKFEAYLKLPDGEPELRARARNALIALRAAIVPPGPSASGSAHATPSSRPSSLPLLTPSAASSSAPAGSAGPFQTDPGRPSGHVSHLPSTLVFIAGGLSVAVGAGLGLWANQTASRAKSSVDAEAKPELRSLAYSRAIGADIALGLGAILAATGFVLRFAVERAPSAPAVHVGVGGLTLSWSTQ